MKHTIKTLCFALLFTTGCYKAADQSTPVLVSIQIQDRNGMTETISQPDRLETYEHQDFLASHPYKKVLRVYKKDGKLAGKISTYHPNGLPWQYLEALDMRANGEYKEWHQNGQLKISANVIGGTADIGSSAQKTWLFNGTAQIWDEKGRIQAEIPYKNGAMEGNSLHYYPSGKVQKKIPYTQDFLDGEAVEFHPNGSIYSTLLYNRGVKSGISKGFWPENQPQWEETYQAGLLLDGKYYALDGSTVSEVRGGSGYQAKFNGLSLERIIEHRRGKPEGLVKIHFTTGQVKNIYQVKNGQKQGEEVEYFSLDELDDQAEMQRPKISIPWEKDAISGQVKTWYNNGKLQSQREFSRNKKSGASVGWYKDSSLMYVEEYEEDRILSGRYYKKGHKDPISTISAGTGIATLYDELGVLVKKVYYQKGKPVDPES
jgi:antitoxin component YwqK of YwqJK toxin-antitoxin module